MTVQTGLCPTWLATQIVGFLMRRLICASCFQSCWLSMDNQCGKVQYSVKPMRLRTRGSMGRAGCGRAGTHTETDRHTTHTHACTQAGRRRQASRQTETQTDRDTDRHTHRQMTDTHTEMFLPFSTAACSSSVIVFMIDNSTIACCNVWILKDEQ